MISEKRADEVLGAVFLSKDKICVLDHNKELAVCNFDGSNLKKFQITQSPNSKKAVGKIDMIFPAPLGKILAYSSEDGGSLILFDISARKTLHELSVTDVRAVYWNNNQTYAAIVAKSQIFLVTKNLEVVNQQKESAKIKTGCFDGDNNAFIYSTSTHIKYMFSGEVGASTKPASGTFKSIDEPVYVSFFMKNQVFSFNRQGELL